jgi:hypothetical protein
MLEQRALNIELVNAYGDNGLRITVEGGSLILQVPTVDALIEHLSRLRAEMQPSVPAAIAPRKEHLVEIDPLWRAEASPLLDGSVVLLRHSGLGWIGFALPRANLERLVDTLSEHLETTPQVEGMPN